MRTCGKGSGNWIGATSLFTGSGSGRTTGRGFRSRDFGVTRIAVELYGGVCVEAMIGLVFGANEGSAAGQLIVQIETGREKIFLAAYFCGLVLQR